MKTKLVLSLLVLSLVTALQAAPIKSVTATKDCALIKLNYFLDTAHTRPCVKPTMAEKTRAMPMIGTAIETNLRAYYHAQYASDDVGSTSFVTGSKEKILAIMKDCVERDSCLGYDGAIDPADKKAIKKMMETLRKDRTPNQVYEVIVTNNNDGGDIMHVNFVTVDLKSDTATFVAFVFASC